MKKNVDPWYCLTPKQKIDAAKLLENMEEETGREITAERFISDAVKLLTQHYAEHGPLWYACFNHSTKEDYFYDSIDELMLLIEDEKMGTNKE